MSFRPFAFHHAEKSDKIGISCDWGVSAKSFIWLDSLPNLRLLLLASRGHSLY